MDRKTAEAWIRELSLEQHPEGGWFRQIYASDITVDGSRPVMTSIYYLLEGNDFSALHRLKQDEQWNFYTGDPLTVHMIHPNGKADSITLSEEGPFQLTVKAGDLFGSMVDGAYALVGCTVAPGFDYADFELPARADLLETYPDQEDLIRRLTRH